MAFVSGLRPLVVGSALFAFAQVVPAQTAPLKVGVVDLQRAVFGSAEIKKADAEMQATFKPRQEKITQLQGDIQQLAQQLQSSSGKLSPQAEAELQSKGQREQRDLQRMQDDLQADANAFRSDVLSKSSAKMKEVVKKLAEEKGLDVIVDTSTALYFKPALDLTTEAIAAYDKAYPAR